MRAEQGPLWGCDPESASRADTLQHKLAPSFGGEVAA